MKALLGGGLAAVLAAFAAPALAASAVAASPEEAVAYAFFGLADGAHLDRGTTVMDWRETAASPAVYAGEAEIKGSHHTVGFTVTAVGGCTFEVKLSGPPGMVPGGEALYARVALDKVTGIALAANAIQTEITGTGFCETSPQNLTCRPIGVTDLFGSVVADQHKAAVAALLAAGCPAAE